MNAIGRTFGLAAAAVCAVALAMACTQPVNTLGDNDQDVDGTNGTTSKSRTTAAGEKLTTTGLPCDMSKALSENCQTCHGAKPQTGASTPLVTWDNLQKDFKGKKVYELVKERLHAEKGRMPPAKQLTDAETKSIDAWVDGGAKQASATCNVGSGPPPATQPFVCNAPNKATVIKAASRFTWVDNGEPDQYVCFGFDEQAGSKRHAISMGPLVENLGILHHLLLFQGPESVSNAPFPCSVTTSADWKLVTGWAPGGKNFELPPQAGFPIEGTTHSIMQVHYNNAKNVAGQSDGSGFQLCETEQLRPNDAGVVAFGAMTFNIPPRIASYTMRCDYKLDERYQGVTFFGAAPHMHKRGIAISTERIPGGTGAPDVVFAQKPFVFENQETLHVDNKKVSPGDVMRTRCTWKNADDVAVHLGEGTADEMCFNFLAYYPAIPDKTLGPIPLQSWISPSLPLPLVGPDCQEER